MARRPARRANGAERGAPRVRRRARACVIRTAHLALGYDPSGLLTAQLQLPPSRYANGPERVAAMEKIFERIAAIPGVTKSGATMNRFLPGFAYLTMVDIENQPTR